MAIETIIFDIGNVLVEWHPHRPYDARIGAEARKALFDRVDFMGMNDRIDLGHNFYSEVAALAEANPDDREMALAWQDLWAEMFAPDLPLSAQCLRALRAKGHPVHALTNFGVESFEIALGMYPVLSEFDQSFVSGRLKMMKPDPAIYAHVEQALGVDPKTILFIDDRADNIAACEARGWTGHLFTEPQGLVQDLIAHGLLSHADLD